MAQYFDRDESIYNWVGENIPRTLEIIANRYIGQNPPLPFTFRAFSKRGFLQLNDGRYDLNLQSKLLEAKLGQWAYLYGMLWSESEKSYELSISSYSPTSVFLDGNLIYRSLLAHETDVTRGQNSDRRSAPRLEQFLYQNAQDSGGLWLRLWHSAQKIVPASLHVPLCRTRGTSRMDLLATRRPRRLPGRQVSQH